jgi:hypothetical protein
MTRADWDAHLDTLAANLAVVSAWPATPPEPDALRCEHSRHRTLAHLRACQQQWLSIVQAFVAADPPRIKVLHPWRLFESDGFATRPWEEHFERFERDRRVWLNLRETVDWNLGGRWNGKADTIGGLTSRLASHERCHLETISHRLDRR